MPPMIRELTASPAHPNVIATPMAVLVSRGKNSGTMASAVGNIGAMDNPAKNTNSPACFALRH